MGNGRKWTAEDDELLAEIWGYSPVESICKKLNRSKNAIAVRVQRLGLPPFLESGEYVTLNQLLIAVTGNNSAYTYKMTSWVQNRGLPVHNKRRDKCSVRVVYIDEFWEWAERNKNFLDFSKMEPLALGKEPNWVAEQRSRDFRSCANQRKDPWTKAEDAELLRLLRQYKYGWSEIASKLKRSGGAVQRRCNDLGIKERPIKASNHNPWSNDDFKALADGIRNGLSYADIGERVNRSEKAVRGRVYEVYRTENADKVRSMIGDGVWGDGKPKLTVWDERHKSATKSTIARLVTVLKTYRNSMEFGEYWQRLMCMKWDDADGCTAGQSNCDDCTCFERIKPQYCCRCGATIIDRKYIKWRVCEKCKSMRIRQHMKKQSHVGVCPGQLSNNARNTVEV